MDEYPLQVSWLRPSDIDEPAAALVERVESWLARVHERAPIAVALLDPERAGADGSEWHAWSVSRIAELLPIFEELVSGAARPTKLAARLLRGLLRIARGAGQQLPAAYEEWSAPGRREIDALLRGDGAMLYALLAGKIPPPRSAALEELLGRLRERPDDPELQQVCGDQLLIDGDPRGELLVLAHRASEPPASARLAELEDRLGARAGVLQALFDPVSAALNATLEQLAVVRPKTRASWRAMLGSASLLLPCRLPPEVAENLVCAAAQARSDPGFFDRTRKAEAERLRELAGQVLAGARAWVAADPRRLGNRLGHRAYTLAHGERFPEALLLYDAIVDAQGLDLTIYNNAAWAAQRDNNGLPLDPARHHRFLSACTPHGPRNPGIFFNAACLAFELGDHDRVLEYLRLALEHGYDKPHALRDEPLFAPLREDPRFVELLANQPRPRTEPEVSGGLRTPSKRSGTAE